MWILATTFNLVYKFLLAMTHKFQLLEKIDLKFSHSYISLLGIVRFHKIFLHLYSVVVNVKSSWKKTKENQTNKQNTKRKIQLTFMVRCGILCKLLFCNMYKYILIILVITSYILAIRRYKLNKMSSCSSYTCTCIFLILYNIGVSVSGLRSRPWAQSQSWSRNSGSRSWSWSQTIWS